MVNNVNPHSAGLRESPVESLRSIAMNHGTHRLDKGLVTCAPLRIQALSVVQTVPSEDVTGHNSRRHDLRLRNRATTLCWRALVEARKTAWNPHAGRAFGVIIIAHAANPGWTDARWTFGTIIVACAANSGRTNAGRAFRAVIVRTPDRPHGTSPFATRARQAWRTLATGHG